MQIPAKFIQGLGELLAELFAPSIAENQEITAYVGEEMTDYQVQGDNLTSS